MGLLVLAFLLSALRSGLVSTSPDLCHDCQGGDGVVISTNTCRCDEDCAVYGDCCGELPQPPSNSTAGALPDFQCRSVFVDGSRPRGQGAEKAFWMVESCAPMWNGTQLEQDCEDASKFYPVTDTNTGVVYSNVHCATCNSISGDTLLHWRYSLVCSETLLNLTQQPNFQISLEVLQTHCQPCSYVEPDSFNLTSPPGLPAPPPRPCYLNTASCVAKDLLELLTVQEWTDEEYNELVDNCVNGPYGLVWETFFQYNFYRNRYCALCNGVAANSVNCAANVTQVDNCSFNPNPPTTESPTPTTDDLPTGSGMVQTTEPPTLPLTIPPDGDGGSFSLVLDVFGDGLVVVDSEVVTTIVTVICSEGQVFDPVIDDCRQTVCPEGFILSQDSCELSPDIVTISDTFCPSGLVALNYSQFERIDNDTLLFNETQYDILQRDLIGRPVVCLSIPSCLSYIALTESDDFEFIDNSTLLYNEEVHDIAYFSSLGQPVICSNFSVNGTREVNVTVLTYSYPGAFVELTYIGCSFSMLGCALILLTYGLFKELRTLPSKILMNLAAAILVSNLFLLLSDFGGDSQDFCIATAIILHLFFLAQFSWMSIMTFEMGRTFNNARKLAQESSSKFKTKLLILYTLLGWGIPAVIVVVSVAVNFTTDDLVLYGETEDGEEGSCWINHLQSALIAFVTPVVLSILFNVIVFIFVSSWLFYAWRTQSELSKEQSIPFFRIYFAIFSITGLTWIFGFLAILAGTSWSWYPFIILNSFQGFTIFVLFLLTRKVLKRYLACITRGRVKELSMQSTKHIVMKLTQRQGSGPRSQEIAESQMGNSDQASDSRTDNELAV